MKNILLGAIAGDVFGSVFEWNALKTIHFPLYNPRCFLTDDTVMTIAVADALLHHLDYVTAFHYWGRKYPDSGYGGNFGRWLQEKRTQPYSSWGNGSAMRVSAVGWFFNTMESVIKNAEKSAAVTHDHPEGIKGAQAVAAAIFLAREGESKDTIRQFIRDKIGYPLDRTLDEIRPYYGFDESCQGSVPEAIQAFLESDDLESSIRLAISLGGDADTQACIAGSIAGAFYGEIPEEMAVFVRSKLPEDILAVVDVFDRRF